MSAALTVAGNLALAHYAAGLREDRAAIHRALASLGVANPASLLGDGNLRATRDFLATFFPPRVDQEFLLMTLGATWKTVAIATVGTTAAVLIAAPLALAGNRVLSLSARRGAWAAVAGLGAVLAGRVGALAGPGRRVAEPQRKRQ